MCPVCYQTGGSLLHCPSTLTIASGIFLLHCPWSHLHRPLTGILPYEARTFLTCGLSTLAAAIICPTYLLYAITHFRHPNTFFLENQVVTIYINTVKVQLAPFAKTPSVFSRCFTANFAHKQALRS